MLFPEDSISQITLQISLDTLGRVARLSCTTTQENVCLEEVCVGAQITFLSSLTERHILPPPGHSGVILQTQLFCLRHEDASFSLTKLLHLPTLQSVPLNAPMILKEQQSELFLCKLICVLV